MLFGSNISLFDCDVTNLFYQHLLSNGENYLTKLIYWIFGYNFVPMVSIECIVFKKGGLNDYLLEDKTVRGVSYFDMLVYCHKKIQQKLNV